VLQRRLLGIRKSITKILTNSSNHSEWGKFQGNDKQTDNCIQTLTRLGIWECGGAGQNGKTISIISSVLRGRQESLTVTRIRKRFWTIVTKVTTTKRAIRNCQLK